MAVTAEQVLTIIAAEAGIDRAALTPDATLTDLAISSLDVVSVAFELEDQYGIEVEPEGISPTFTVAQLVEHIVGLSDK